MKTTLLMKNGQLRLPKSVRDALGWGSGTTLSIEVTGEGVLLRPAARQVQLSDVFGCLKTDRKPASDAEFKVAIQAEVKRRHEQGRY